MRKDAKIGFAIGGVLLAVLTVYLLVVPRHHNAVSPRAVTLVVPPVGSAVASDQSVAATGAADKTAGADKPADSKPDAVAKSDGVNWEKLFPGAGAEAPPLMTATPSSNAPSSNTPHDASDAAATGGASPSADNKKAGTDSAATAAPVAAGSNSSNTMAMAAANSAAPATRPSVGSREYTVKPGQTLSLIAGEVYGNQRFYVAILRANPNLDPHRLRPGMKINLPDASEVLPEMSTPSTALAKESDTAADGHSYVVRAGDTLYGISKKKFGTPREASAIYALNKDAIGPDESHLKLGMTLKLPDAPLRDASASTR